MSQHETSQPDATRNIPTGSDETTTLETLLDASHPETSTLETSHPEPATTPSYASPYAATYAAHPPQTAQPEYKSSPAPTTTVFGLLGLLTAIAVLVSKATDLDIPWGVVGPVAVVGAGVLLVVLGLAGLRGQRFRG